MIFYISSKERAGLLDEIAEQTGLTVSKAVEQKNLNRMIIKDMSNFNHVQYFAVDLSALSDNDDEVLAAISAFSSMYCSRVIVITSEDTSSGLLAALIRQGVYNIVTAPDAGRLKVQLEKCFSPPGMSLEDAEAACYGYKAPYAAPKETVKQAAAEKKRNRPEKLRETEEIRERPAPPQRVRPLPTPQPLPPPPAPLPPPIIPAAMVKPAARRGVGRLKQHVTVALCGAGRHIGTTHQALLITRFLNTAGFTACYMEANNHKSIALLDSIYDVSKDQRQPGLISLDGLDMYYGYVFPEVAAKGYDFFVFDLGSFGEVPAEEFLTKDIKIIVGGGKAWELPEYENIYQGISGYKDLHFLLNFVPKNEQGNMLYLLKQYRNRVFFSDYAPYSFDREANRHIYAKLFGSFLDMPQVSVSPRRLAVNGGGLRGLLGNTQKRGVNTLD